MTPFAAALALKALMKTPDAANQVMSKDESLDKKKVLELLKKRKAGQDPEALDALSTLAELEAKQEAAQDIAEQKKPFFPSGNETAEAIAAEEQLSDIVNAAGPLQETASDTISQFQDESTFGTGERLVRRNPIGEIAEQSIMNPNSNSSEFLANVMTELGDDEISQALKRNKDLYDLIKTGIEFDPVKEAEKKSSIPSTKIGSDSSSLDIDPDALKLLAATGSEDLSADALKADIAAGIGEEFLGRRPSYAMTRSGAFKGSTPDVAKSIIAQKLQAKRDLAKLKMQAKLQNNRSMLEKIRLAQKATADNAKIAMDQLKLSRKIKNDQIKAINNSSKASFNAIRPLLGYDQSGKNIVDIADVPAWAGHMKVVLDNQDKIRELNGLPKLSEEERKLIFSNPIEATKKYMELE